MELEFNLKTEGHVLKRYTIYSFALLVEISLSFPTLREKLLAVCMFITLWRKEKKNIIRHRIACWFIGQAGHQAWCHEAT